MASGPNTLTIKGTTFHVIPDGEICRKAYSQAAIRVVHILKEVSLSKEQGGGLEANLMKHLKDDGTVKYRLWNVTARRSFALQHALPQWENLDQTRFGKAFKASAVINLNDTFPVGDGHRYTSKDDDLFTLAGIRWSSRKKKLSQLKPTVVVCGGTALLIRRLLRLPRECFDANEGFFVWQGVPFIKAYHPSYWGKKAKEQYARFRQRCRNARRLIYE